MVRSIKVFWRVWIVPRRQAVKVNYRSGNSKYCFCGSLLVGTFVGGGIISVVNFTWQKWDCNGHLNSVIKKLFSKFLNYFCHTYEFLIHKNMHFHPIRMQSRDLDGCCYIWSWDGSVSVRKGGASCARRKKIYLRMMWPPYVTQKRWVISSVYYALCRMWMSQASFAGWTFSGLRLQSTDYT